MSNLIVRLTVGICGQVIIKGLINSIFRNTMKLVEVVLPRRLPTSRGTSPAAISPTGQRFYRSIISIRSTDESQMSVEEFVETVIADIAAAFDGYEDKHISEQDRNTMIDWLVSDIEAHPPSRQLFKQSVDELIHNDPMWSQNEVDEINRRITF